MAKQSLPLNQHHQSVNVNVRASFSLKNSTSMAFLKKIQKH